MDSRIMDHPDGYGLVSRFLHWFMAAILLWQAISAALHYFADDTPIEAFFFQWHFAIGFTIFVLVFLRGAWGLINIPRRPAHDSGVDRAAVVGHVALYGFMVLVPALALLRAYGSVRGFSVFGIEIFAPRTSEIEWMTALGNEWHGFTGWIFFLLIAGHIAMALVHSYVWKQRMIARITYGAGKA